MFLLFFFISQCRKDTVKTKDYETIKVFIIKYNSQSKSCDPAPLSHPRDLS